MNIDIVAENKLAERFRSALSDFKSIVEQQGSGTVASSILFSAGSGGPSAPSIIHDFEDKSLVSLKERVESLELELSDMALQKLKAVQAMESQIQKMQLEQEKNSATTEMTSSTSSGGGRGGGEGGGEEGAGGGVTRTSNEDLLALLKSHPNALSANLFKESMKERHGALEAVLGEVSKGLNLCESRFKEIEAEREGILHEVTTSLGRVTEHRRLVQGKLESMASLEALNLELKTNLSLQTQKLDVLTSSNASLESLNALSKRLNEKKSIDGEEAGKEVANLTALLKKQTRALSSQEKSLALLRGELENARKEGEAALESKTQALTQKLLAKEKEVNEYRSLLSSVTKASTPSAHSSSSSGSSSSGSTSGSSSGPSSGSSESLVIPPEMKISEEGEGSMNMGLPPHPENEEPAAAISEILDDI